MYPELFHVDFVNIKIFTYAACIVVGSLIAIRFTIWSAKKELGVKLPLNKGQLFLIYIGLYAFSQIIIELFRDDTRGYIINNVISHSQTIALCLLVVSIFFHLN